MGSDPNPTCLARFAQEPIWFNRRNIIMAQENRLMLQGAGLQAVFAEYAASFVTQWPPKCACCMAKIASLD
jgi:hypothetical protein